MHIPENYLAPAACGVMTAAMVPVWAHAVKRVRLDLPKDKLPMIGVGASFSFLAMMFNVPLVGGTTGHAVGGTLAALLFGPDAACIAVSTALLLQALIFGDGGILAFGANCFNMAFVLPYLGYFIYQLITRAFGGSEKAGTGTRCAAVEFGIQPLLFTDSMGNALYCPYDLSVAIPAMMIPHLAVAGLIEAAFTTAVYAFVDRTAPDLIYDNIRSGKTPKGVSHIPVFALMAVMIALTPLGLLAAGTAWGEWGAEEIAEVVTNGTPLGYTPQGLLNGWSLNVPLPDYALEGMPEAAAYILSAVIGASLLIILFKLFSLIPARRKV